MHGAESMQVCDPSPSQDMEDIVNTIQESWDKYADARLSTQCVYERLSSFVNRFESLSKDSGFGPQHPISFISESVEVTLLNTLHMHTKGTHFVH